MPNRRQKSPSDCHPERVVRGRGLCGPCYQRDVMRKHPERRRRYWDRFIQLHPEYKFINSIGRVHGITEEEYTAMLIAQNYKCKICGRNLTPRNRCLDHDHKTDRRRGLLCRSCNRMLGWFETRTLLILEHLGLALK